MIANSKVTIYHKGYDATNRVETWTRYNYNDVWFFGGKGSSINKGYDNANDVNVRIPYNNDLNINNFSIGDIIVQEELKTNITSQEDLNEYLTYNITSINNNNFGNSQHIHIGGI